MFGRRATVVAITKYLEAYQQNESLPPKLFKAMSSSFQKAVRKTEEEVVEKLKEGSDEDHARHEDFILSYIEEPLKTQIYNFLNRGLANANTLMELKKIFADQEYEALLETLKKVVKRIYVEPNKYIFDPNSESSANWAGIILFRHGEAYYVENNEHHNLEYLDCIDMLGVRDHAFVNGEELSVERVKVVSRSACLVSILTMHQLIDAIKSLYADKNNIDNAITYILARCLRRENEHRKRLQEEELQRQEQYRRHLIDWAEYMKNGDIQNVSRYVDGGFDVNVDIGSLRDKPIIISVQSKNLELLRYLFNKGANVNGQNADGMTALHIASQIGWKEGIQYLITLCAKMLPDKRGNYPVHIAAQQGNKDILLFFKKLEQEGIKGIDWYSKNMDGQSVIDCCEDIEMKKLIVPKGTVGYSFAR